MVYLIHPNKKEQKKILIVSGKLTTEQMKEAPNKKKLLHREGEGEGEGQAKWPLLLFLFVVGGTEAPVCVCAEDEKEQTMMEAAKRTN